MAGGTQAQEFDGFTLQFYVNVGIGLGWTIVIIALAGGGVLGAGGPLIAAVMHNVRTLIVMANSGGLLKFQEILSYGRRVALLSKLLHPPIGNGE